METPDRGQTSELIKSGTVGGTVIGSAKCDRQWTFFLIYFAFFLSGAAALIYEISWSRQIGLLFGHTVHAASIVLASYFCGMAIGYWIGAKWSSRVSPLLGYTIAELIVAGWAFVVPILLVVSESSAVAPLLSSSSVVFQTTSRAVFSFCLLLPGTVALGVTLPMMAVFFAPGGDGRMSDPSNASRVTMAYAMNTAGALLGVLSATLYLMVVVGVRSSSYVAAALSILCALTAFVVSRIQRPVTRVEKEALATPGDEVSQCNPIDPEHSTLDAGLLALVFLSGFGTLALQVLFTRMFSLVFHNSTYTFGIVIAVFLASMAIGAALVSWLQSRFSARRLLGITTGLGGLATSGSVLVFVWLTKLEYFRYGDSFTEYMIGALALVSIVVAPAIICLGMILPLLWTMAGQQGWDGESTSPTRKRVSLLARKEPLAGASGLYCRKRCFAIRVFTFPGQGGAGDVVGRLTAINTLAAAAGALTASFFMLTWIGLWQSIVLVSCLYCLAALALLWKNNQRSFAVGIGLLLGMTAFFALRSPVESVTDRQRLSERLIKRWNSSYGWIDVVQHETTGSFKIRQNLHYRFGKTGSNAREFRQAHIPLLLHKNPRDVMFMGLGTGLTAGGAIPHPNVERIVAVELIPEVIPAVRMLSDYNYNVVDHPKVEIRIDDARHYLLAHERQFDVIVSDLFVPWESESGYLYTVENYQVALERLKPDGLFCQWLPIYQLGVREFESIANSFASVFPNTTVWWAQLESTSPVIALIGTREPLNIEADQLADRLNELNASLKSADHSIATTELFWDHYMGDWIYPSTAGPYAKLNTDEHPRVEFLTPVSNRDRNMIRGARLKRYYDDVLSGLPSGGAVLVGAFETNSLQRRRARQRLILFGE